MASPIVIGVSSYAREGSMRAFNLPCGYIDSVRAAGGVPVILPPGEDAPERLLDVVDGLILAGGGDIAPASYGGAEHETIYMVSEERDQFELALARAALARRDIPVLCICRGAQVLNIVCGGSLHTHIPDVFGEEIAHRLPPRRPTHHPVRVAPESHIGRILQQTDDVTVCSWHHQSIDRVGTGLTPVAWAADGVIEAVEHETHPWYLAVQWHPEMQPDDPVQQRLFPALIEAAGRMRAQ